MTSSKLYVIGAAALFCSLCSPASADTSVLDASDAADDSSVDRIYYNQSQHGAENLRIHLNDVTLVVAPSDQLLQLLSASAVDVLNSNANDLVPPAAQSKPSAATVYSTGDCGGVGNSESAQSKCKQQQAANHKKNRLRLSSLLVPLLNRAAGRV